MWLKFQRIKNSADFLGGHAKLCHWPRGREGRELECAKKCQKVIKHPETDFCWGRVKIHRVPGPGPSTGGEDFYEKNQVGEDFFSKKIRGGGAKIFFEENQVGENFFQLKKGGQRQIFPKTGPRYPVNFDRSLMLFWPHRYSLSLLVIDKGEGIESKDDKFWTWQFIIWGQNDILKQKSGV